MTVLSPPTWVEYGTYDARHDRMHFSGLFETLGATRSTDFTVAQSIIPSMTVTVSVGTAYFESGYAALQGAYGFTNDATIERTHQPSDPTNPRIDRIVARVYDSFFAGTLNSADIEIIKGEAAVSPQLPDLPISSIELARVSIAAAATTVVTANINNTIMPLASLRNSLIQNGLATAWTTFTPAFSNLTVGAGINIGRYKVIGKTAFVTGSWTFGAGSAVGTNPTLTLPVASWAGYTTSQPLGAASLLDNGTAWLPGWARWLAPTSAVIMPSLTSFISATTPFTWTSGDTIAWNLTYEIA